MIRPCCDGRIGWPAILLALLLAAALISFVLIREAQRGPNILWITLDSCRYDHLGCYGYDRARTDNIDFLARQGVAFSQAISQSSATRFSVPSLVTGRYPLHMQARGYANQLEEEHRTVAELLQGAGYRTWVITQEEPVRAAARGFEHIESQARTTAERTRACLDALQVLKDDRFLIWLYYWDPHAPYRPPPQDLRWFETQPAKKAGDSRPQNATRLREKALPELTAKNFLQRRREALGPSPARALLRDGAGRLKGELAVLGEINFRGLTPSEQDRQHLINLYDAEIAMVDAEIGRVVAALQELDLWDETMVLVTADHAEAFGEHDKYYHGLNLYDEVVRVPLVIKPAHSRQRGDIITSPVRNVDIAPTIMDYCHLSIPQGLDGTSLRPALEGQPCEGLAAYMETFFRERGTIDHLFMGYRTEGYKLVYDLIAGTAELYDLHNDPGEQTNLLESPNRRVQEDPVQDLERRVKESFLSHLGVESLEELAGMKLRDEMDQETEERLRALGYIE